MIFISNVSASNLTFSSTIRQLRTGTKYFVRISARYVFWFWVRVRIVCLTLSLFYVIARNDAGWSLPAATQPPFAIPASLPDAVTGFVVALFNTTALSVSWNSPGATVGGAELLGFLLQWDARPQFDSNAGDAEGFLALGPLATSAIIANLTASKNYYGASCSRFL